jgi:hypothetical protein
MVVLPPDGVDIATHALHNGHVFAMNQRTFSVDGVDVPLVCTLNEMEAHTRANEWTTLVARDVVSISRATSTRLELVLRQSESATAELVHLAQQEKTCCSFFRFVLEIEAETMTLVVEVPELGASILDDFARVIG